MEAFQQLVSHRETTIPEYRYWDARDRDHQHEAVSGRATRSQAGEPLQDGASRAVQDIEAATACRGNLVQEPVCSGAESFIAGTASCRVEADHVDALYAERKAYVLHPADPGSAVDTDWALGSPPLWISRATWRAPTPRATTGYPQPV